MRSEVPIHQSLKKPQFPTISKRVHFLMGTKPIVVQQQQKNQVLTCLHFRIASDYSHMFPNHQRVFQMQINIQQEKHQEIKFRQIQCIYMYLL